MPIDLRVESLVSAIRAIPSSEQPALAAAFVALLRAPNRPGTADLDLSPSGLIPTLGRWLRRHDPAEAPQIAAVGLVRCWNRLPAKPRSVALKLGARLWPAAVETVAAGADDRDRAGLVAFLADHPLASHLALAVPHLDDETHRKTAVRAIGGAWGRLVGAILTDDDDRELLGEPLRSWVRRPVAKDEASLARETELVAGALADAVESYETHGQRDLVAAAVVLLALGRGGRRLAELLAAESPASEEAGRLLRATLRRHRSPMMRRAAWRWLAHGAVGSAALDRLGRARGPLEHRAVLDAAHLALNPKRRRAMAMLEPATHTEDDVPALAPGGPLPGTEDLAVLPAAARRALPGLIRAIDPPARALRLAVEPMLADPDDRARLAALAAADVRDLPDFVLDPCPPVSRSAAWRWSTVGADGGPARPTRPAAAARVRIGSCLTASPHPTTRLAIREELARLDPWADTTASRIAMRRWRLDNREAADRELVGRLADGDAAERRSALRVIRALGLEHERAADVIAAAAIPLDAFEGADTIVAFAVSILGRIGTPEAARALAAALRSEHPRVRANAIESAARRGIPPELRETLAAAVTDDNHRVRASAARARLRDAAGQGLRSSTSRIYEPAALEVVTRMLDDERPMHRLAGAWLAERELAECPERFGRALRPIAERVTRLSREEPEIAVRRRAKRVAARMYAGLSRRRGERTEPERVEPREARIKLTSAA
ncbi:MAG: HEAT repeat domain-containing protein [Planctomycetota bacterium]